jgi:hypothetical protein
MKITNQNFKKNSRLGIVLTAIMLLTFACSKPENGKDGIAGTNGAKGSANVIYSSWENITFKGSVANGYTASITAPKITQEIIDRGTILCYFKYVNESFALPFTGSDGVSSLLYYNFSYSIGLINFRTNFIERTYPVRYIIIPGGASATGKMAQPDYKKMSYKEVCQSLHIPE